MNDRQSTNTPSVRKSQTDTALASESFVLQRGVADRASISEGAIYLLLPTGEYARVEVPSEDVARVARVLLGRPAVLLLAHDAPLPALPEASEPAPVDTGLPGTVAYANRLRDLARTMHPSNFRSDLFALADDLSNAPDPCRGYPTAEAVLRTCDTVIGVMSGNGETIGAAACQRLRDRLAKVMAGRPAQASDGGTEIARLRSEFDSLVNAVLAVAKGAVIAAEDLPGVSHERMPAMLALVRIGHAMSRARDVPTTPAKTYAEGIGDAADAVAKVALEYRHTTLPRIALNQAQDALVALKSGEPESVDIANVGDVDLTDLLARIDIAADQALDGQGLFCKVRRSAVRRIVESAVRAAFQSPPPVPFDPAKHCNRAEVLTALESDLDACTHDHPVLAGLLARFRTVSEAA